MIDAESRLGSYPFALLSELRDAANEHGYRIGPEENDGWILFRSATAPGEIGLAAASPSGPFFLSVMHQGAARALDLEHVSSEIKGHAGVFIFATRERLHAGVQAVYRLSACLPNFPLEKYSQAIAGIGDTEAERTQKFRIGQGIFRDALLEYWQSRCPLTGITSPDLLKASHIMPWSHCKTDAQRLDVYNGLLLSALWDAAFDAGMVSFNDDGAVLASAQLDGAAREALALKEVSRLVLCDEHRSYMAYHRSQIWTPG